MEIRIIVVICIIIYFVGWVILASIRSFERDINKKIDKLNDKIDDIGLKTNYTKPQHEDVYTKLNLLSSMLNDIRNSKNSFHTNNNEIESEK